jgi:hypothetical protein
MSQPRGGKTYAFDRPGNYRIRVLGLLDERFSERLGGLRINPRSQQDSEEPVTELVGQVRDQAELAGLLNDLYELHLTLRSVEYIDDD